MGLFSSEVLDMASNLFGQVPNAHAPDRPLHKLSTGGWIAVFPTGATTLSIYHSTNKTTWTSVGSVTVDSLNGSKYGCAVDASNNLFITWINESNVVRYVKCTYAAGPTYTAGTQEDAMTSISRSYTHCSIETLDSDAVIVVAQAVDFGTPLSPETYTRVRTSGGTWGTKVTYDDNAAQAVWDTMGVSVARNAGGASSGSQAVVFTHSGGEEWWVTFVTINLSTGASSNVNSFHPPNNSAYDPVGWTGDVQVFSTGSLEWTLISRNVGNMSTQRYVFNSSGAVVSLQAEVQPLPANTRVGYPSGGHSLAYINNRVIAASLGIGGSVTYPIVRGLEYEAAGPYRMPGWTTGAWGLSSLSGWAIFSGENRYFTEWMILAYNDVTHTVRAVYYNSDTYVPKNPSPDIGGVISSNTPTLMANPWTNDETYSGGFKDFVGNRAKKMQWQLATDVGFTTSLKTVTERGPGYRSDNYRHNYPVPDAQKLSQGTWYMRYRSVDIVGGLGTLSTDTEPVVSFTVSHPPTATNLLPIGDITKKYESFGGTILSWIFTDPSDTDSQYAYQVIIERNSDGASVLDTGKVVSGLKSIQASISSTYKDTQLRWKVRLWDQDDVVGAYSDYALFRVSDPPTIAFVSPTVDQVLDNPQPLIDWTFSAGGGRTQVLAVISIINRATNAEIFNSGWVLTSETQYQLPSPVLVDDGSYTVVLTVADSGGLASEIQRNFTTNWVPPTDPSGVSVDAATHETLGYVNVTWSATPRDADFFSWRIYRKEVSTGEILLLAEYTNFAIAAHHDWLARSGVSYQYAVVQVANRFGILIESAL